MRWDTVKELACDCAVLVVIRLLTDSIDEAILMTVSILLLVVINKKK